MSTSNELAGIITHIFETQTFPSGFSKREFVIKDDGDKYPQSIKFELTKDGCGKLDSYKVGDAVLVKYNVRGNEFNGKFFVSLQCWRLEKQGQGEAPPQRATSQNGAVPPASQEDDGDSEILF